MRILLLFVLLSGIPFAGKSTETIYLSFDHRYINIELMYNDGNHANGDKLNWYYEGLSSQLNDYIARKILTTKKEDSIKFTLSIILFDASSCMCCPLEFSRTKNECRIQIAEKNYSLHELTRMIDYFFHPKWKPFSCKQEEIGETSVFGKVEKTLDKFVPIADSTFFKNKSTTVYEIGDLKIDYENDSLILKMDNWPFPININFNYHSIVPAQSGKFYFIADDDSLYVVKERKIINSIVRPKAFARYNRIHVTEDWLIYSESNVPRIVYSIHGRYFYRIEEDD